MIAKTLYLDNTSWLLLGLLQRMRVMKCRDTSSVNKQEHSCCGAIYGAIPCLFILPVVIMTLWEEDVPWWPLVVETISALLALSEVNPTTDHQLGSPLRRASDKDPWGLHCFILTDLFHNQSICRWYETSLRLCDVIAMATLAHWGRMTHYMLQ